MKMVSIFFVVASLFFSRSLNADASDTGNSIAHSLASRLGECLKSVDRLGEMNDGGTLNLDPLPYLRVLTRFDNRQLQPEFLEYPRGLLSEVIMSADLVSLQGTKNQFTVSAVTSDYEIDHVTYKNTHLLRFYFYSLPGAASPSYRTVDIPFLADASVVSKYNPRIDAISFSARANKLVVGVRYEGIADREGDRTAVFIFDMKMVALGKVEPVQKIDGLKLNWLKTSQDGKYIFGTSDNGPSLFLLRFNSTTGLYEHLNTNAYNFLYQHREFKKSKLSYVNAVLTPSSRPELEVVVRIDSDGNYKLYSMTIDVNSLETLQK